MEETPSLYVLQDDASVTDCVTTWQDVVPWLPMSAGVAADDARHPREVPLADIRRLFPRIQPHTVLRRVQDGKLAQLPGCISARQEGGEGGLWLVTISADLAKRLDALNRAREELSDVDTSDKGILYVVGLRDRAVRAEALAEERLARAEAIESLTREFLRRGYAPTRRPKTANG